jgi:hypothetical protein
MKSRRPTIPLSKWELAVDLELTGQIQAQEGTPAHACDCRLCLEWKRVLESALPEDMYRQLQRIGINLLAPTDLYGAGEANEERNIRITFHLVGKLLSGPDAFTFSRQPNERALYYEIIRESPYFSMRVLPNSKSFEPSPVLPNGTTHGVVCIDIRLCYEASALAQMPNKSLNSTTPASQAPPDAPNRRAG